MENKTEQKRPAVAIFVYNKVGHILLGKRIGKRAPGQWGTPGGCVDPGESIETAVLRELFEETGTTPLDKPKILGDIDATFDTVDWKVTFVSCQINEIPKNCEPDKCAGWDWYSWDNLPDPVMHSIEKIIEQIGLENLKLATSVMHPLSSKKIEKQI